MKRLIAIVLLMSIGLLSFAQNTGEKETSGSSDEMKTLFKKSGKVNIGWFVGIDPGYTKFNSNDDAWLAGMSAGMILNHNFTIGLTGRVWMPSDQLYYNNVKDTLGGYFQGGYGGLLLEYTLFPKSVVHVTFPVLIGAGGAYYITKEYYFQVDEDDWDKDSKVLDSKAFFVVEPGIRAEVNITKFMRFNAGVSYRYAPNFQLMNTPKDMINSFTGTIGLKFGKF